MSIVMLKKLGAKQILGNIQKVVAENCKNDGDRYTAYSIYGTTDGIKTGVSTYGEWTAFTGHMEAINHASGESFAAASCFIPEPLQSILRGALAENDNVEFAFSVEVKRRDDLKEGYEYNVIPHKAAQEADPLSALRSLIPSFPKSAPKLDAPKVEEKEAVKDSAPKIEEKKPEQKGKGK